MTHFLPVFSSDAARKPNVLATWEVMVKQGGSCGICEQAVARSPSSAWQRSPLSVSSNQMPVCMLHVCVFVYAPVHVCVANLTGAGLQ